MRTHFRVLGLIPLVLCVGHLARWMGGALTQSVMKADGRQVVLILTINQRELREVRHKISEKLNKLN